MARRLVRTDKDGRGFGITCVYNRQYQLPDISVYRAISKDSYDHAGLGDVLEFTHDERDITNTDYYGLVNRELVEKVSVVSRPL